MMHLARFFSDSRAVWAIPCVWKRLPFIYFLNNSVKNQPILIILVTTYPEEAWRQKITNLPTSHKLLPHSLGKYRDCVSEVRGWASIYTSLHCVSSFTVLYDAAVVCLLYNHNVYLVRSHSDLGNRLTYIVGSSYTTPVACAYCAL